MIFKSKYKKSENFLENLSKLEAEYFNVPESYKNFIKENNVICFDSKFGVKVGCANVPLEILFGFSRKNCEDLIKVNREYKNRIPDSYVAIASANYGDFICLSVDGGVYHWDHEVNDLYFSENKNEYKRQDTNLELIGNSFDDFIGAISDFESEAEEEDDFMGVNVQFPDEALDLYFINPKIFFLAPSDLVDIDLKKLELSAKGKLLLEKFREEGLLE